MRTSRHVVIALLVALSGAAACRSASPYDVAEAQPGNITLVVRNNNFNDVDVYAVSSGLATRIGTVTGNSSATFTLNPSLVSPTDFRIVATPIGGNGRASTGPINVSQGQTIEFTVGPVLSQSTVSIR
ncbi:MAG TPA: hypothetical protein VGG84_04310 [Gemmatimonadaceae bacterium]|jgi:hypothetical protein